MVALAAIALGMWQQKTHAAEQASAALIKAPPHGVVVDTAGLAVPDCELWLRYEADQWFPDHRSTTVDRVTTDAEGRFQFKEAMRFATLHGSLETECFTILARKDGVGVILLANGDLHLRISLQKEEQMTAWADLETRFWKDAP